MAEPAPVRSYVNRKGLVELGKVDKQNAEYERKHNKQANKHKAQVEKAKEERRRKLEREKAREQSRK
jgi:hypothetical protein